jgi:CHASE3 domain sensor protein
MNIEELLEREIHEQIEALRNMDVGSEEYKATVDGLTKIVDRLNEIWKCRAEFENQDIIREEENKFREKQAKREQVYRWTQNLIAVAGILLPLGVTIWGTRVSLKFEEEGVITTSIGRGFINKLLHWK